MQTATQQIPPLAEYVDLDSMQARLSGFFPTATSFRWFVRQRRDILVDELALIMVAGRMKFHPALTETVVVKVGRQSASRMTEGDRP